jgi:3-oxoacyl-[acyl-carrier protein] reductase
MDLGISGRVAMVAAASKGIGLAVATALAKEGCRVSICSRDAASLEGPGGRSWRRHRAMQFTSSLAT